MLANVALPSLMCGKCFVDLRDLMKDKPYFTKLLPI